jgi:hypothetical protein
MDGGDGDRSKLRVDVHGIGHRGWERESMYMRRDVVSGYRKYLDDIWFLDSSWGCATTRCGLVF